MLYLAQFFGYRKVVEMPICPPKGEDEDAHSERVRQYKEINGKWIAMVDGACYAKPKCQDLLRSITGVQCAHYYLEFFMKRFKPWGEQRLRQLIVKFVQLMMTAAETLLEFIDRIQDCATEIRACDPSHVPKDEQVAVRTRAGIELAFPHLHAALQVGAKR